MVVLAPPTARSNRAPGPARCATRARARSTRSAKVAREARYAQQDSKRRKMREDLEQRERTVVRERSEEDKAKARLKVGAPRGAGGGGGQQRPWGRPLPRAGGALRCSCQLLLVDGQESPAVALWCIVLLKVTVSGSAVLS